MVAGVSHEYIALLIPVDWLLDRVRTTINLMGNITLACLADKDSSPS